MVFSLSPSRLLLLFYSCLLTLWHVIDRHEAWGFGQVDQMDPVIFDIMQFSKPIFDGYNQNCIKIQLLSCWSLRQQIKKNKQIMRIGASSKECTDHFASQDKVDFFISSLDELMQVYLFWPAEWLGYSLKFISPPTLYQPSLHSRVPLEEIRTLLLLP